MMKVLCRVKVLIVVLVALVVAAPAIAADYVLNPTTYRSASGRYELYVNPSAPNGSGPAFYRMTLDGIEVWAGERPFTLREAKLTNGGRVAGYAYEGGVIPTPHNGYRYSGLTVCILDLDGETLQRDSSKAKRKEFRVSGFGFGYGRAYSKSVSGTLLDEAGDRFVLLVPRSEWKAPRAWWIYRLTTGEFLEIVSPDRPGAAVPTQGELEREFTLEVKRVPETPFVVAHWYLDDGSDELQGRSAAVSVLGLDGKQLWKRNFPKEYSEEEKYLFTNAYDRLSKQLASELRSFSFHSFSLGQRLSFSIERDSDSGWRVIETGRVEVSIDAPTDNAPSPKVEILALEELEPIRLQHPSGKGQPIAKISDFAIDDDGCFAFLGWSSLDECRFIRVAPDGVVLADISLDELRPAHDRDHFLSPALKGRWFIVQNDANEEQHERGQLVESIEAPRARAWIFDPNSAELNEIKHFSSSKIVSIAPTDDGGFISLSTSDSVGFGAKTVSRFDRYGTSIWKWNATARHTNLTFDAVTWLPGVGVVALAGTGSSSLTFLSQFGDAPETEQLTDLLKREFNYLTGAKAGRDGGLLLYDFNTEPSCIVIDSELKEVSAWTPRLEDGRSVPIVGDVQAAPDGSFWTSDGQAFLRLNDDGVVDKVVRPLASDGTGGYEEIWTVDSKGRIYTFNGLTAEVRVYASDGSYLHACKTESADYDIRIEIHGISVDGEGNVHVQLNYGLAHGPEYLVFSPTGERIGWKEVVVDSGWENWHFKPDNSGLWVLGYDEIYLLDEDDQLIKTILRRANGDWLQYAGDGAVAADGSLAVICGPIGMRSTQRPAVISIYDAKGEPRLTLDLQEEDALARLAYNGKRIVVADDSGVFLYDLAGKPPKKFVLSLAEGEESWCLPFFSPDGTELWIAGIEPGELRRYQL